MQIFEVTSQVKSWLMKISEVEFQFQVIGTEAYEVWSKSSRTGRGI